MLARFRQCVRRLGAERARQCSGQRPPTFERLERRVMLSVAAEFDALSGTLTLTGDGDNDRIEIEAGETNGQVVVRASGLNNDGDDREEQTFSGVEAIQISTDGGRDRVSIEEGLRTASDGDVAIDVSVDGGSDRDRISTAEGDDTVIGGSGRDRITTGDGADFVDGEDGRDDIRAGGDDDTVVGGAGRDNLRGGSGDDELSGDAGEDRIRGGRGQDNLDGGDDDDDLDGGRGTDAIRGGDGDDDIREDDRDSIDDIGDERSGDREPNDTTEDAQDGFTLSEQGEIEIRGAVGEGNDRAGDDERFVDDDGDGFDDNTGEPVGDGNGEGFVDNNGDGFGDNTGDGSGFGANNGDGDGFGTNNDDRERDTVGDRRDDGIDANGDDADVFAIDIIDTGILEVEVESVRGREPVTVEILDTDGVTVLSTIVVDPDTRGEDEEDEDVLIDEEGTYFVRVTTPGERRARYEVELDLDDD